MIDVGKPGAVILVDTNIIIELHRTGSWPALTGAYRVVTVEDCVTETQTGYQRRSPERLIHLNELKTSLSELGNVNEQDRTRLRVQISNLHLDRGEESLWAHALARSGKWFLCSPDKSSLRAGVRLQKRDHLVSTEELLERAGHRPLKRLRSQFTKQWMYQQTIEILLDEQRYQGRVTIENERF